MRVAFFPPYSWISYFFGVTQLKLRHFIIGNNGLIFPIGIIVYTGASAQQLSELFHDN